MKTKRQENNYAPDPFSKGLTDEEKAENSKRFKQGIKNYKERNKRWDEKEYIVWVNTDSDSFYSSGNKNFEVFPKRYWNAYSLNELIKFLKDIKRGFNVDGKYGMYTDIEIFPITEEYEWVRNEPQYKEVA